MLIIGVDNGVGVKTREADAPSTDLTQKEICFNQKIAELLVEELKRCKLGTLLVSPGDSNIKLEQRVQLANVNRVNLYIAIRYRIVETIEEEKLIIYYNSPKSAILARDTISFLRGIREEEFSEIIPEEYYILNETDMPAILVEGWTATPNDDFFQTEVAKRHALGICQNLGVPYIGLSKEPEAEPMPEAVQKWINKARTALVEGKITTDGDWEEFVTKDQIAGYFLAAKLTNFFKE